MPNNQYQQTQSNTFNGPLDLLTQDYQSKAIDQNQARLINMYLEPDSSKGKYQIVAYSTPGLGLFCDTEEASVRALLEHREVVYAVAGNHFYSIASDGTKTQLGTLNTSSGFAKMVVITGGNDANNQIVIIDGTNGYHYNIGTATAQFPITDVDFPQTAVDIVAQDDYVIVQALNSISFYISNLADGTSYNALDFSSKTGFADNIAAIASCQKKLFLLGTKTTEPYYNSGNDLFPFDRINDIFIHHGCAARRSVVSCGEYIVFLSKTAQGGYQVIQLVGYTPKPIGSPASDYQISQMTSKSDALGLCYQIEGHEFYALTFPTDGKTIVYDLTTGITLERQSDIGGYTRFLGQCGCFCYDKNLIGDYNSGKIYYQSSGVHTENGTALRRMFISPPISVGGKKVFISRLQIDVECNIGSSKTFTLDKSTDGGRTWTAVETFTVGADSTARLYRNGLGSARTWMFRITTTMNGFFALLGFIVDAEVGES